MGALNPRVFILTLFLSKGEHLVLIFPKVLELKPLKSFFGASTYWGGNAIYYCQVIFFAIGQAKILLSKKKIWQNYTN